MFFFISSHLFGVLYLLGLTDWCLSLILESSWTVLLQILLLPCSLFLLLLVFQLCVYYTSDTIIQFSDVLFCVCLFLCLTFFFSLHAFYFGKLILIYSYLSFLEAPDDPVKGILYFYYCFFFFLIYPFDSFLGRPFLCWHNTSGLAWCVLFPLELLTYNHSYLNSLSDNSNICVISKSNFDVYFVFSECIFFLAFLACLRFFFSFCLKRDMWYLVIEIRLCLMFVVAIGNIGFKFSLCPCCCLLS